MQLNIWVFADKKYNWVSLFGEELSWSKSHRRLIIDHAAAGIHLEYWSSCVLCNRFITTSNHFRTFLWISSGREPAVVIRLLFIVSQSGRWAGQDGAVTVSVPLSAGLALSMVTPPATLWHHVQPHPELLAELSSQDSRCDRNQWWWWWQSWQFWWETGWSQHHYQCTS